MFDAISNRDRSHIRRLCGKQKKDYGKEKITMNLFSSFLGLHVSSDSNFLHKKALGRTWFQCSTSSHCHQIIDWLENLFMCSGFAHQLLFSGSPNEMPRTFIGWSYQWSKKRNKFDGTISYWRWVYFSFIFWLHRLWVLISALSKLTFLQNSGWCEIRSWIVWLTVSSRSPTQ